MQVGVIGVNHKLADLHTREILAKAVQKRFGTQKLLHPGHHFILLLTCNRTEIYFSSSNLADTHTFIIEQLRKELSFEFEQKLYSFFSWDCFFHLAKVTAGFDSVILGETEIQGQVKSTYISNAISGILPKELHFLFQKSLKIGKDIRTNYPLYEGLLDLEHAVLSTGKKYLKSFKSAKILFVGASEINLKIMRFLKKQGASNITFCNRTQNTLEKIKEGFGFSILPFENLAKWEMFDWIIVGTKSPDFLIKDKESQDLKNLVIDLSVPRNVDPKLANNGVDLFNIDDMNSLLKKRKKENKHLMKQAFEELSSQTRKQCESFLLKSMSQKKLDKAEIKEICFA